MESDFRNLLVRGLDLIIVEGFLNATTKVALRRSLFLSKLLKGIY